MLLLRRHRRSGFAAGAWVFPGGTVEEADEGLDLRCWSGIDPEALADRFADPPSRVLGFHVAAVRETFEEAGVLLADGVADEEELRSAQVRLGSREIAPGSFSAWVVEHGLVLDLGALAYCARWITPRVEGRRYDTAFFCAALPDGIEVRHDDVETTARRWIGARDALDSHAGGELPMIFPTVRSLEWLARHPTSADAIAAARGADRVPWVIPHVEVDDEGRWRFLLPGDPDFPLQEYAADLRGPLA